MFLSNEREQVSPVHIQNFTQEISAELDKDTLVNALHAVNAAQMDTEIGWVQILFTGEDKIIFSSTSHNLSIRYEINAVHNGIGNIKVSGRQFSEYIKQLPPSKIYLKAELPYHLKIKCAGSSAKIQLIQDPSINQVVPSQVGSHVIIKGFYLQQWLNSFKDLVLVDDMRFYANGALIWTNTDENNLNVLFAVASDAHRLCQAKLTEISNVIVHDNSKVIVPKKALEELRRECTLYPEKEFSLKWSHNELSFSAESEGYLLFCKCIAGAYPPYEAAFPNEINFNINLKLKEIQDCVKRSLIFADKNRVMKFIFENSILKMSCITVGQKEGEEVIDINNQLSSPFEVNYNGTYLAGILSVISGNTVNFSWESITKPVKIVGEEIRGLDVFYLLVPNRY